MNKKGFTLTELLAVIIIIAIIMGIVFPSISRIVNDNKKDMYKDYERTMIEYAKLSPLRNNTQISLNDLNVDNALNKIIDECTGYVSIDHSKSPIEYTAHISCDSGYNTDN